MLYFHTIITPIVSVRWSPWAFQPPLFTFLLVFIFWSLHIVAGELENPFEGTDANDLDVDFFQIELNRQLVSLVRGPSLTLPKLMNTGKQAARRLEVQMAMNSTSTFCSLNLNATRTDSDSTWCEVDRVNTNSEADNDGASTSIDTAHSHDVFFEYYPGRRARFHMHRDSCNVAGKSTATHVPGACVLEGSSDELQNTVRADEVPEHQVGAETSSDASLFASRTASYGGIPTMRLAVSVERSVAAESDFPVINL